MNERIERGVLTAANAAFWPCVWATAQACQQQGVPYCVVNHGLLGWQYEWLRALGVLLREDQAGLALLHATPDSQRAIGAPREAWRKPFLIATSPFERTLWIDADAVPVGSIESLFALLDVTPFVAPDFFVFPAWSRNAYFPLVSRLGFVPRDLSTRAWINSGVLGVRAGDRWLSEWCDMCRVILGEPHLLALCGLREQSALVAAQCIDRRELRIVPSRPLNCPANYLMSDAACYRKKYPADTLLAAARADHPDAIVVHWMGRPKPE